MASSGKQSGINPRHYTRNVDETVHSSEHVAGHKVDFTTDRDVDTATEGTLDDRIDEIVDGRIRNVMSEREKRENIRANHRNKNRLLTLAGAIIIGIIVTYFFQNNGFPILGLHHVLAKTVATTLYGYSFVVTVTLDASLALYSYVKHY